MTGQELQAVVRGFNERVKKLDASAFVAFSVREDHFAINVFNIGWGRTHSEAKGHTAEAAIAKFEGMLRDREPQQQRALRLA